MTGRDETTVMSFSSSSKWELAAGRNSNSKFGTEGTWDETPFTAVTTSVRRGIYSHYPVVYIGAPGYIFARSVISRRKNGLRKHLCKFINATAESICSFSTPSPCHYLAKCH